MDISDLCRKFSAGYTAANHHYSAEGQERGERSRQHCYQEKENGTPKAPPIYTIPFLPHVLPKVMLPSISIPRGPSVKAEEKPLSLQKKAISSQQQVEKVPVGVLSIPTTCHSFHLWTFPTMVSPAHCPPSAPRQSQILPVCGALFMKLLLASPVPTDNTCITDLTGSRGCCSERA